MMNQLNTHIDNPRPRHVLDLRRLRFSYARRPVDGIVPRMKPKLVVLRPKSGQVWRKISLVIIIFACALHLATVGGTRAYFADNEGTHQNLLESGGVDFSLLVTATSSIFSRVNCMPYATTSETVVVVPASSTNPFIYFPEATHFSGDDYFCNKIDVTASLNNKKVYEGDLDGLSATATATPGTWNFVFKTKVNQSNKQCNFDIVFKGWQTRHNLPNYETGGFKDLETSHISLATWGVRINKVYHTVASDKGSEHKNEWVELYNQTNSTIDIGGWKICDNDSCDTIPSNTKIGAGRFAVLTGEKSTFDYWPAPSGVKRVVLSDGTIGNGLSEEADMLVLTRSGGEVVDTVNWGMPDASWPNFLLENMWNPGATFTTEGLLARVPTGFDTNSASDWKMLSAPSIDLAHPNEDMSYEWTWGHNMNIVWNAHNSNGPDEKLKIALYYIKDKDGNGIISPGDKVHTITEKAYNDGDYNWDVPWGFTGTVWIQVVATGPENPMLLDVTVGGPITFKAPGGQGWHKFKKFFDTSDGDDLHDFKPVIDMDEFVSPLFKTNAAPESTEPDDEESRPKKKDTDSIIPFDFSELNDLIQEQVTSAVASLEGLLSTSTEALDVENLPQSSGASEESAVSKEVTLDSTQDEATSTASSPTSETIPSEE